MQERMSLDTINVLLWRGDYVEMQWGSIAVVIMITNVSFWRESLPIGPGRSHS